MFRNDGKEYRNLQEQVLKNKDDIANLIQGGTIAELGIKIINAEAPLNNATQLPNADTYTGDYGDGYIVGSETPFRLYVYSRSTDEGVRGYWFDWGLLNAPSTIQGPIGPQGIQGEQGVRGSFWYSQSGAPTNTVGVNENDQALDGISGDTYQFVNGAWQITGNIRGPQGIQGIQGIVGPPGPQGQTGPQGPQGPQGEFIQIIGELDSTDQLPMVDSVPHYAAYLIPDTDGAQHVWLIIGEGTTANPYLWHDAGGFGGGTKVTIDGAQQSEVEVGNVIAGGASYQIADNTQVTTNGSEVTFTNLQVSGQNLGGQQVDAAASIELPIASSSEVELSVNNNTLQMNLAQQVWNEVESIVEEAQPQEVQITAPSTSTNGQLSESQLETLQANKGAYLMFNNEIYRLQDSQHVSGYLVYSHLGFDNTANVYKVKCITVTISTRGWVLSERTVIDPGTVVTSINSLTGALSAKYLHLIKIRNAVTPTAYRITLELPLLNNVVITSVSALVGQLNTPNINATSVATAAQATGFVEDKIIMGIYSQAGPNLLFGVGVPGANPVTISAQGIVISDTVLPLIT